MVSKRLSQINMRHPLPIVLGNGTYPIAVAVVWPKGKGLCLASKGLGPKGTPLIAPNNSLLHGQTLDTADLNLSCPSLRIAQFVGKM